MRAWIERLGLIGVGHTLKQIEEVVFDYVLYPAAILYFGTLWGGVLMTTVSAIECYLLLRLYDWLKLDLLGLETIKSLRDQAGDGAARGWLAWGLRHGDIPAFFALSFYFDPLVTTAYLRRGAHAYDGMARRDWAIFGASILVSNLIWIGAVSVGLEVVRVAYTWVEAAIRSLL